MGGGGFKEISNDLSEISFCVVSFCFDTHCICVTVVYFAGLDEFELPRGSMQLFDSLLYLVLFVMFGSLLPILFRCLDARNKSQFLLRSEFNHLKKTIATTSAQISLYFPQLWIVLSVQYINRMQLYVFLHLCSHYSQTPGMSRIISSLPSRSNLERQIQRWGQGTPKRANSIRNFQNSTTDFSMFVLFHLAFSTPIFPFHIILFSHFESRCSQITSYHLPSLSTFVIVSTRQAVHFASMFIIFYILFHMLVCRFCSPLHPLRPPPSPYLSPSA